MRTKRLDRPPLELDDYSGEFQPDLHNYDFARLRLAARGAH
jgi:hypothetical protein